MDVHVTTTKDGAEAIGAHDQVSGTVRVAMEIGGSTTVEVSDQNSTVARVLQAAGQVLDPELRVVTMDEETGELTLADGEVYLIRNGQANLASPGDAVQDGDVVFAGSHKTNA